MRNIMRTAFDRGQPPTDKDVALIADLIRTGEACTRAELIERSGLGRNSVSTHLATSTSEGLVSQSGRGASKGGRAPITWKFNEQAGTVLTACIGVHSMRLALTDLKGTVLSEFSQAWDLQVGPEPTLQEVVDRLITLGDGAGAPVWGLGVSLPGPIDHASGRLINPPIMNGWDGFEVGKYLSDKLDLSVVVENDVNAMALGHRAKHGGNNSIYFLMSTGVGAGILSAGRIHRGTGGAAGDLGHTRIPGYDKAVCRCGRFGCLEAAAGGWALERSALRLASDGMRPFFLGAPGFHGTISTDDIIRGTLAGDTSCIELVATAAIAVGTIMSMLVSFYNPDKVVLAGAIPTKCSLFSTSVERTIKEQALPLAASQLSLEVASSPEDDGIRGCALMMVEEAFGRATSARVIS